MESRRVRHLVAAADAGPRATRAAGLRSGADSRSEQHVVRLQDSGTAEVLGGLDERLDVVLKDGPRTVVVDMSAVTQVSSTTIAALLWIKRRCSGRGVGVLLRKPSRRSVATLERIGLLRVLVVERDDSGQS